MPDKRLHASSHALLRVPSLTLSLQKNKAGEEVDEEKKSLLTLLVHNVLRNPYIWGMVSPTAANSSSDPIFKTEGCYCGVL